MPIEQVQSKCGHNYLQQDRKNRNEEIDRDELIAQAPEPIFVSAEQPSSQITERDDRNDSRRPERGEAKLRAKENEEQVRKHHRARDQIRNVQPLPESANAWQVRRHLLYSSSSVSTGARLRFGHIGDFGAAGYFHAA